ncbi:DNA-protecting protein DprA [Candidatus Peregrinibacteria bacterium]|nr:DNA-protecting protein DprA [Candidatus Peregrinibacteria bacterium]
MSIYHHLFNSLPGMSRELFLKLLSDFPSLEYAWEKAKSGELLSKGCNESFVEILKEERKKRSAEKEQECLDTLKVSLVTQNDQRYPSLLKAIYDPPILLYVKGTLLPEDSLSLAIVGSRTMSYYGEQVVETLIEGLSLNQLTIVSGFALGVDSKAHRCALQNRLRTIAVLGTGIDRCYPSENKKLAEEIIFHGALITELPLGSHPERHHFPLRNRIIAGMTLGTLVVEAKERSGSLITARQALEYDREVFTVPGAINHILSFGTNRLIQAGEAYPVMEASDIIRVLEEKLDIKNMPISEKSLKNDRDNRAKKIVNNISEKCGNGNSIEKITIEKDLQKRNGLGMYLTHFSLEEKEVLEFIDERPVSFEFLTEKVKIAPQKLSQILSLLELKNIVRNIGAERYVRKKRG